MKKFVASHRVLSIETIQRRTHLYTTYSLHQIFTLWKRRSSALSQYWWKKIVFDILTPGSVLMLPNGTISAKSFWTECSKPVYLCTTPINEFCNWYRCILKLLFVLCKNGASPQWIRNKTRSLFGRCCHKDSLWTQTHTRECSKFFWKDFSLPLLNDTWGNRTSYGTQRVTVTRTMQELIHMGKFQ